MWRGRLVFGGGEEEEAAAGTRGGGVEPAVEVEGDGVWRNGEHVDDDGLPLTALRLVAGDSVGIFDLEGVPVGARAQDAR